MKIDLHVHTALASPCSNLLVPEIFEVAKIRGLDGICITDHSSYAGFHRVKRAASDLMPSLKVFFGVEIRTTKGDMLIYSPHELSEDLLNCVPQPQYLIDCAHEVGGLAVAAHPFRRTAPGLGAVLNDLSGLDGIEVRNGNCPDFVNSMALASAKELDVFVTSSSDAHCAASLGAYYSVFDSPVTSQVDLIKALSDRLAIPAGDGRMLKVVKF